jgi:adenylate cyclase
VNFSIANSSKRPEAEQKGTPPEVLFGILGLTVYDYVQQQPPRCLTLSLFNELKRRNVIRVAIAYIVMAWLVMQVADVILNNIEAPGWVFQTILLLLGIGFLVAMFFSWAFEMTPEGLKREHEVDRTQTITGQTGKKLNNLIFAVMGLALAYFAYDKFSAPEPVEQAGSNVSATPSPMQPSIAVLPFVDLSPEGDQEYFSDGISEELLNLLVHVDGLMVASRTSSFSHKGDDLNLLEIARELKVAHVLEGSVRKAGNRVRITAQLIDAATDRHLWSDTYDRELTDIFTIQDEIANAIVEALSSELGLLQGAAPIVAKADTSNLDAYQLYLEARSLFLARQNMDRSISLFEAALELDPGFARAWEGLGAVLSVAEGWGIEGEDFNERSRAAAQKAIELDPSLSMAWAVIGSLTISLDADYVLGMTQLDQAVENDPMSATAWFWRGLNYSNLGFADQGIKDVSMCIEIDPAYMNCYRHLARIYLTRGEVDKSLDTFLTSLEKGLSVNDFWLIHALLKRDKKHAASLLLISESNGDPNYPFKELLYAVQNPLDDHSEALLKLEQWLARSGGDPGWRMAEWIALGAYDRVESNVDVNQLWLDSSSQFRVSPFFKPLVIEMGWHKYWLRHGFPPQCRALDEEDFECS